MAGFPGIAFAAFGCWLSSAFITSIVAKKTLESFDYVSLHAPVIYDENNYHNKEVRKKYSEANMCTELELVINI